jgi:hypothetical protein
MKKSIFILVALSSIFLNFASCSPEEEDDDCIEGYGILKIGNGSLNTVHKIMIDGINYGTLDPGDVGSYPLRPGKHEVQSVGIAGGAGCSPAQVIIVECGTESLVCKS